MFYFEKKDIDIKQVVSMILNLIKKQFERENIQVKGWVLSWLNFVINQEFREVSEFQAELVINLILYLSNSGNEELKKNTVVLLNYLKEQFFLGIQVNNINYVLNFVFHLL